MAAFLSAGWFELLAGLGTAVPSGTGFDAHIQFVVTGSPDGEVRWTSTFADGVLSSVDPAAGGAGGADEPDATITLAWADAVALVRDEVDLNVSFMRGRAKVVGNMAKVLDLLVLTQTDPYQALATELAAGTEVPAG